MEEYSDEFIERIAAIAHAANRAYCFDLGDYTQPSWDTAPDQIRASSLAGVRKILVGEVRGPGEAHESWRTQRTADGWVYGEKLDRETKVHPDLVPFEALPVENRVKSTLFFNIVKAFKDTY